MGIVFIIQQVSGLKYVNTMVIDGNSRKRRLWRTVPFKEILLFIDDII